LNLKSTLPAPYQGWILPPGGFLPPRIYFFRYYFFTQTEHQEASEKDCKQPFSEQHPWSQHERYRLLGKEYYKICSTFIFGRNKATAVGCNGDGATQHRGFDQKGVQRKWAGVHIQWTSVPVS